MAGDQKFISLSALLCEPARASMLWHLLDGRAYTASELAFAADLSLSAASNHLSKLLTARIVKVETQGRHRYFSFDRPEVAYAVESLANLVEEEKPAAKAKANHAAGIKYCRTCYDHLAGYAGVQLAEAMEQKKIVQESAQLYVISNSGWKWLEQLSISKEMISGSRRPEARQCLDWSERRPHIAGQLGAVLLQTMLQRKWFKKMAHSRELLINSQGRSALYDLLKLQL